MEIDRELVGKLYYRICVDTKFQMDYIEVAKLVARIVDCHPLQVANSIGMDLMERMAKGTFTPVFKS